MVRYFYAWTPLAVVGTVSLLTLPWLGLIALMIVAMLALGALAGLAWAVVLVPYMLGQTISRRWNTRSASQRTAAARPPAGREPESVRHGAPSHRPALSVRRDPQALEHAFRRGHES